MDMMGGLFRLPNSRLYSMMPKHRRGAGFTIVEILIVLAVTGVLFLSAVILINGKQNVTSFNQSIRNIQNEMQQVYSDVSSGYYPYGGTMTCAKGSRPVLGNSGTDTQGKNLDCLFLGKVVQFGISNTDPQQYLVFTVVGLRGSLAAPATDLASANARVIAPEPGEGSVPAAYDTKILQYGLTVSSKYLGLNPGTSAPAVAFTSNLNTLSNGNGSQQVNVTPIRGSAKLGDTPTDAALHVDNSLAAGVPNPAGGVKICFNSGGTNQSGLLSIGGDGRQGNVDLKIFNSPDCA
jgi:type II secretory pathway pseudopilin PulG